MQCINLMIASRKSVQSNQGGLGLGVGLVVGRVLGGESNMEEVVGVVVDGGERWLMACASKDNCDKMVDKSTGLA
jgi:hypothetical protein